jgi:hypothetical protein
VTITPYRPLDSSATAGRRVSAVVNRTDPSGRAMATFGALVEAFIMMFPLQG